MSELSKQTLERLASNPHYRFSETQQEELDKLKKSPTRRKKNIKHNSNVKIHGTSFVEHNRELEDENESRTNRD